MTETAPATLGLGGRILLAIEKPPLSILYRAALGYFIMPIHGRVWGETPPGWSLIVLVTGILILLRIVPGIVRRVLPFPREVKSVWANHRQLAKAYDSFQWRKLFGLGLGWLAWLVLSHATDPLPILLAVSFLFGGGMGIFFWRKHATKLSARPCAEGAAG